MDDLLKRRRRILEELSKMPGFDMSKETHPGGYVLWVNDWLQEDILILQEIRTALSEEQWKEFVGKLIAEGRKEDG
jgi:hypothetical protein